MVNISMTFRIIIIGSIIVVHTTVVSYYVLCVLCIMEGVVCAVSSVCHCC